MPEHVRISQTIARFSPAHRVCLCHLAALGFTATTATGRILPLARPCFRCRRPCSGPSASGPKWLEEAAIADLIAGTIQIGEHERHFYELTAWALMPNPVHLLILPKVPV